MVHPWIQGRIARQVAAAREDPAVRLIVLDAAVMLEAGWDDVCNRLVYVDAPPEVRLRRVADQRGWAARDLEDRERAQLPLTEKAARADHVLINATTLDDLERQVDALLHLWGLDPPARGATAPGNDGRVSAGWRFPDAGTLHRCTCRTSTGTRSRNPRPRARAGLGADQQRRLGADGPRRL